MCVVCVCGLCEWCLKFVEELISLLLLATGMEAEIYGGIVG